MMSNVKEWLMKVIEEDGWNMEVPGMVQRSTEGGVFSFISVDCGLRVGDREALLCLSVRDGVIYQYIIFR